MIGRYRERDGTLGRPYNLLEKRLKPYYAKLLAEGFKANLPLIQEVVKSFWNEVRGIPAPVVVSNLGKEVDFWVPFVTELNNVKGAVSIALAFRELVAIGMKEYINLSEGWINKNKGESKGVLLAYLSPTAHITQLAEVKDGRSVRYLALPFVEHEVECKDGVPSVKDCLHPRWMAFAPADTIIQKFIEAYEFAEPELFKKRMKEMIARVQRS
jgi:hypothetical protein